MSHRKLLIVLCLIAAAVFVSSCERSEPTVEPVEKTTIPEKKIEQPEPVKPVVDKPKVNDGMVMVKVETSKGTIMLELNSKVAPITVANFVQYVNDGAYDGTIFHRVIKGFMIQGGGFNGQRVQKETRDPIKNETGPELLNKKGTISMARTNNINSATNQFFINHVDNPRLDHNGGYGGYAVFGKVVEGMDVVEAIANVQTTVTEMTARIEINGNVMMRKQQFKDVPVENVVITKMSVVE